MKETLQLGDRMKRLEAIYDKRVDFNHHMLVRLDGHKFSKLTKNFKKPFDSIFTETMEEVAKAMMMEYNPSTIYVQSDEITLIFPMTYEMVGDEVKNNQLHGGRVMKICSLFAAFASIKFNKIFRDKVGDNHLYQDQLDEAILDARIFSTPNDEEVLNALLFRIRDAERNSKSMFASTYCTHKALLNKNSKEQVEFCLEKTGNNWEDIESKVKWGSLIKKEMFSKESTNRQTGEKVNAYRTRLIDWSEKLDFSYDNIDLILRKLK